MKRLMWTVEMADKKIEKWTNIKAIIQRSVVKEDDTLDTKIYKLYLKLSSVNDVANELNMMGERKLGASGKLIKFVSNDISDTISNKEIEDKELQSLVRDILKDHTDYMSRFF